MYDHTLGHTKTESLPSQRPEGHFQESINVNSPLEIFSHILVPLLDVCDISQCEYGSTWTDLHRFSRIATIRLIETAHGLPHLHYPVLSPRRVSHTKSSHCPRCRPSIGRGKTERTPRRFRRWEDEPRPIMYLTTDRSRNSPSAILVRVPGFPR